MSSEPEIQRIIAAFKIALEELRSPDYDDVLNACTDILITTLKTAERLTTAEAYLRIVNCFTDAAGKTPKSSGSIKYQRYQKRQRLVAQRAAQRAAKKDEG